MYTIVNSNYCSKYHILQLTLSMALITAPDLIRVSTNEVLAFTVA